MAVLSWALPATSKLCQLLRYALDSFFTANKCVNISMLACMCMVVFPIGFMESIVGYTSIYSTLSQLATICCTRFDTTIWPNWITQSGFSTGHRSLSAKNASYVEMTTSEKCFFWIISVSLLRLLATSWLSSIVPVLWQRLTLDNGSEWIDSTSSTSICGPAKIRALLYCASNRLLFW